MSLHIPVELLWMLAGWIGGAVLKFLVRLIQHLDRETRGVPFNRRYKEWWE